MQTTKIYENTNDKPVYVRELAHEIAAHDRVSITAEFHTPLNLANYPGVIDVLAEEAAGTLAGKTTIGRSAPATSASAAPGSVQGTLNTQRIEGK